MKIVSLALACILAVTSSQHAIGLEHGGVRGLSSSSSEKMLMGGTIEDFLNSMVGFGDISQAQMNTVLGFVARNNNAEHLETVRHGNSDEAFQKVALRAYIEAQLKAGRISADTGVYLSRLFSLNQAAASSDAASSAGAASGPAVADYVGNGNVALLGTLNPVSVGYETIG